MRQRADAFQVVNDPCYHFVCFSLPYRRWQRQFEILMPVAFQLLNLR